MRSIAAPFLALAVILPIADVCLGDSGEALEPEARELVAAIAAGRFDAAVEDFDETMIEALPPTRLEVVWQQITATFGEFEGIEGSRSEELDAYRIVFVRCAFAKGALDAKIVYDSEGHVAGLFFVPAAEVLSPTPQAAAAPPGVSERQVTVGTDPWALPGTLTLPAGEGPFPAVVLVHGSGPNDRDETIGPNKPFRDLAWGLAERGVAVLRYEKRTKQYAERMAGMAELTVYDETVDDARAAVSLLAGLPEIDRGRIVVLGHSLGGTLAPRIAAGAPGVAGLIIMAGATRPLEELLVSQLQYLARLDGTVTPAEEARIADAKKAAAAIADPHLEPSDTVDVLGSKTPGSYWLDLRRYDPAKEAAGLMVPMLILQGGRDYQVRIVDVEGWKKALDTRQQVTFKIYPDLNHLFMEGSGPSSPEEYSTPGHVATEVLDDIAGWIKELQPAIR